MIHNPESANDSKYSQRTFLVAINNGEELPIKNLFNRPNVPNYFLMPISKTGWLTTQTQPNYLKISVNESKVSNHISHAEWKG